MEKLAKDDSSCIAIRLIPVTIYEANLRPFFTYEV
jgi:hypothetical protein